MRNCGSVFFAPAKGLAMLGLNAGVNNAVDFGCGCGTFAVPAAKVARGMVPGMGYRSGF